MKVIRNWLNILFMAVALVGLYIYVKGTRETGIYVILFAMMIKFTESALRMIKKDE